MSSVLYIDVADAIAATGMVARGGFHTEPGESIATSVGGAPTCTVVVIGNVGGAMWERFRAADPGGDHPLDTWTRSVLQPVAEHFGATFVHPSDEPFQPFQRWAQRAEDVWPSPIALLIHPEHGMFHAYRGALLFPFPLDGLPSTGEAESPCLTCADQPCLTSCPVDAFTVGHYAADACRTHVRSGHDPACGQHGCAARLACPVGTHNHYGPDQMQFHMRAFVG